MCRTMKSTLPLEGIRILDLSRVLAGPWCTMALGDLGAEVIKVEHPVRGDDTRDWGKRVGLDATTYFNSTNRNKRSITLDLQTEAGQKLARDLAKKCDVVVQNFKFGGAEKLNVGYEQIKEICPDIVYCSISGYDRSGPEAERPGYDVVIQGETGLMNMNGVSSQPPLKFGTAVVDMFTGMYATQAILAALLEREKTKKGRHIEMALFDSGLMITAFYGLESLINGQGIPRYGNAHPSIIPYGVYDAADGTLVIAVGNNSQYVRFCVDVIFRPDLVEDERFSTNLARTQNRELLLPEVSQEVAKYTRKELLERMQALNIPCGEVLGLYEALTSERTTRSNLVQSFPLPTGGDTPVLAPPYRIDGERAPVRYPPPILGEGTSDVLSSILGLSESDLADLNAKGVI